MADREVNRVSVNLAERSYDILVTTGSLVCPDEWMPWSTAQMSRVSSVLLVTDRNLETTHARTIQSYFKRNQMDVHCVAMQPGEPTKSLESAQYLYDQLAQIAADRRTLVCAVGGGVIGDLAGFVAATYLRGLPFYQEPTTLLAQVDSSVGGKVAVNHARGKNLIGCFYQPVGVLIDTDVLQSLPDRQYRCGLAEVVKYGVILDAQFFEFMEDRVDSINARNATVLRTLITRCCELKALVVEQDEREQGGQRAVLNFGHTFAHAFENLGNYQLLHGEAVAVGMVCASRLAVLLGRVEKKFTDRLFTLLNRLNLPTRLTQIDNHEGKGLADGETRAESHSMFDPDQVVQSMRYDKKAISGTPQFVLPSSLGKVELVQQVDPDLVRRSLIESSLG